ncbi:hypothetical protein [Clostridium polynesiense]|uniref:hypothetical protein n=1 Tax=Clostridium polynesiense TaxID=1325933 RepID=UPI0005910897|nr:hypothetical protein [Clostridium polynesiense]
MVIGIMGDSCVGKSSLAECISEKIGAEIITGKDYLSLAKSESMAKVIFKKKLNSALSEGNILYVISEEEQLSFLPEQALRVLVTADLETIKFRFSKRMKGNLPEAVSKMLERKYGLFTTERHDICVTGEDGSIEKNCEEIIKLIK